MYIVKDNFLKKEEKEFIDKVVLSDTFPWYYCKHQVYKDYHNYFYHTLMARVDGTDVNGQSGKIWSRHFDFFKNIVERFCKENKINLTKIFRGSLNCTVPIGVARGKKHVDHPFDHYQIIIYLNDADGPTKFYNDKGKLEASIKPKKYRILFFTSKLHSAGLPVKSNRRVVAVLTFI